MYSLCHVSHTHGVQQAIHEVPNEQVNRPKKDANKVSKILFLEDSVEDGRDNSEHQPQECENREEIEPDAVLLS
jgi:hypothetical protein